MGNPVQCTLALCLLTSYLLHETADAGADMLSSLYVDFVVSSIPTHLKKLKVFTSPKCVWVNCKKICALCVDHLQVIYDRRKRLHLSINNVEAH